ncbi:MAG: hypothetical protein ACR2P8_16185 [Myxococcota bacterium]
MTSRKSRLALVAGLLALLAGAGCATMTEADVKQQLSEAAKPYARRGPQQLIPIYAESRMVAIGLIAEARSDPSSSLSRGVGRQLDRARRRNAHVVVGGPYPDLSDRILTNALKLNAKGQLRGLNVVFVSDEEPTSNLIEAARLSQTRIHHQAPR